MKEYNYVVTNNYDNSAEIYKIMADSDEEADKKFMIKVIENYDLCLFDAFYEYLDREGRIVYKVSSKHEQNMKTFYFIIASRCDSDLDRFYKVAAENEKSAQEKFMKYICKVPLDFDDFVDYLSNNQDFDVYVMDKIENIE